eukprot:2979215-Alexandrium_andersonii.AAC.1
MADSPLRIAPERAPCFGRERPGTAAACHAAAACCRRVLRAVAWYAAACCVDVEATVPANRGCCSNRQQGKAAVSRAWERRGSQAIADARRSRHHALRSTPGEQRCVLWGVSRSAIFSSKGVDGQQVQVRNSRSAKYLRGCPAMRSHSLCCTPAAALGVNAGSYWISGDVTVPRSCCWRSNRQAG